MPFPIHPPKHMPCPHWNHFPIPPMEGQTDLKAPTNLATAVPPASPPPSPDSYAYCKACNRALNLDRK